MLSVKKSLVVLLGLVLGLAMAWIHPVQPVQVEQTMPATPSFGKMNLLDNDDVVLDTNIHNSRKCKWVVYLQTDSSFVSFHFAEQCLLFVSFLFRQVVSAWASTEGVRLVRS